LLNLKTYYGSSHQFAVPISVLWVGLQKIKITKLGCEKYFLGGHMLSTGGDVLNIYL
jgi:hypothetical protein